MVKEYKWLFNNTTGCRYKCKIDTNVTLPNIVIVSPKTNSVFNTPNVSVKFNNKEFLLSLY